MTPGLRAAADTPTPSSGGGLAGCPAELSVTRLTIHGVDKATSVPERLCFKCGKITIEMEHILCPGCTTKLQENAQSYWNTHVPEGATVVTQIDRAPEQSA